MTDHCTWFPEGWWAHCCDAHDADYLAQIGKWLSDSGMWQCVAQSGEPWMAAISAAVASVMLAGVTMFGRRFYTSRKAAAERNK